MLIDKFPIAIVGMSFRLPGDIDNEKVLWSALALEKDLVTEIPNNRWDKRKYYNHRKDEKGKSYTFSAGVLSNIDEFDNKFFSISPREATDMDPQHRMLLELTWEALENGAQNPDDLKGSNCAVFVGISGNEYSYNAVNDTAAMGPYSMTGSTNSIASNRISYIFDLHGPSMSIDTACSSSLVALHQACSSIWSGESDMAIASGSNMLLHPMPYVGFSKASMLSPDGRCKSFDNNGTGYVRAEGGIVLFIKPLSQAKADGDPIHALILNSGVNSDGRTSVLPLPNDKLQYELLNKLYSEANIHPNDISYIEAHGTGTPVGDPIEASALSEALARKRKNEPLLIGSIKSNIGHLETASGLAGVLKGILSLKHHQVPATIHQNELNKHIDFNKNNVKVVNKLLDFPANSKGIIGVNSFGFGGTNAHVILKEYKPKALPRVRALEKIELLPPIVLSANNEISLQNTLLKYRQYLIDNIDRYYDIAYTLFFTHKKCKNILAFQPKDIEEVTTILECLSENKVLGQNNCINTNYLGRNQKIAVVYSGNGSQWVGMGLKLYEYSKQFKASIDKVSSLFSQYDDQLDLISVLKDINTNHYEYTEFAQPLLFAIQVAITEMLVMKGIQISAVIGHSVGEVSAAWASGALSLRDAVKVIYVRSAAQGLTKGKGRMAAMSVSVEKAKAIFQQLKLTRAIEVAGVNSPNSLTITGKLDKLEILQSYCERQGIFFALLDLDYSFHSKYMNDIKGMVLEQLANIKPSESKIKYISTVTGKPMSGKLLNAEYWWKNIRKPVKFYSGIQYLIQKKLQLFVDVGPHPIMNFYINECLKEEKTEGIVIHTLKREVSDPLEIDKSFLKIICAGGQFNIEKYFPIKGQKMRLPAYSWNKSKFWNMRTSEDMGAHELKSEHFLLGWRIKKNELSWENHFDSLNCGYIKDHVVGDAVVMPAAGFMEMVLAAQSLWKTEDILEIENFEIKSPLILESDVSKHIRLNILSDSGDFEIKSKIRFSDDDFTIHVKGRMLPKAYSDRLYQRNNDVDNLRVSDCELFSQEQHYQLAEHIGLKYGKTFQAIKTINANARQAIAELQLNDEITNGLSEHILHPVILDMCFQTLIPIIYYQNQHSKVNSHSAFLPVSVNKIKLACEYLKQNIPVKIVTNVTAQSTRSVQADFFLYDKDDKLLVSLLDSRFKRTELVQPQKLPELQEFIPFLLESYEHTNCFEKGVRSLEKEGCLESDSDLLVLIESLICQYLYETVKELFPAKAFSRELATTFIVTKHKNFWDWAIAVLIENNLLSETDEGFLWEEVEEPVQSSTIWQLIYEEDANYLPALVLIGQIAGCLKEILIGNIELDEGVSFSGSLYDQCQSKSYAYQFSQTYIDQLIKLALSNKKSHERLKILEIGSGVFADSIISQLTFQSGEYHLISTKENIPQIAKGVKYAILKRWEKGKNLFDYCSTEKNNLFDLIIVNDLALNPELFDELSFMGSYLKQEGILLLLNEYPAGLSHFLYGLNPNWWHFNGENNVLPIALTAKQIKSVLQQHNFETISFVPEFKRIDLGSYLIAAKCISKQFDASKDTIDEPNIEISKQPLLILSESGENIFESQRLEIQNIISLSALSADSENFSYIASYNHLLIIFDGDDSACTDTEYLVNIFINLKNLLMIIPENTQISVLTFGGVLGNETKDIKLNYNPKHAAISGFFRVVMNEFPSFKIKLIDIQDKFITDKIKEIIFAQDNESEMLITKHAKYALRLLPAQFGKNIQNQPVKLGFKQPGSFSYLDWRNISERELAEDDVRIKPKYAGLNFRDVMYALGFVSDEAVEKGFLGATLGMEMAGDIIETGSGVKEFKLGDRVMGFASGSFGDVVQTKADSISHLPKSWTYADGATVPTTFLTAYYSFSHIMKLNPGERVLIHGAAGGVGIAAIQLARHFGVEIYATAGSKEKRDFLKLLGIEHIYDSRSYAYADEILADTNGEGVDVILNSLAGEAINANFRILRPFGKFIELGKRDFYENTKIGLRPYRNNLSYFGVDVDQLMIEYPDVTKMLFQELMDLFLNGTLKPLPYIAFNANNIQSAFKYMQQSKQIGKIVIDFSSGIDAGRKATCDKSELVLSANSTYMIVGGTAGFGFETACFLIAKGARNLILISRSGKVGNNVEQRIKQLKNQLDNLNIEIKAVDIANRRECEDLFKSLESAIYPVKGIINAAAVYDDQLIKQMSEESFEKVLRPKVDGSYYLDVYSRSLNLDYFILFSSVTTFFGNIGQANYVSANAYMESLVKHRIQLGYVGLYVSWGPIADAGYLTRSVNIRQTLEHTIGGEAISSNAALEVLESLMQNKTQGVSVMDFNLESLSRVMPIFDDNKYGFLEKKSQMHNENVESFLNNLFALNQAEALCIIVDKICLEISEILGVDKEEITMNTPLSDIGIDSLMGAEFAIKIEKSFGVKIPALSLLQSSCIESLAGTILGKIKRDDSSDNQDALLSAHGEGSKR